jgi:hypothetical protein
MRRVPCTRRAALQQLSTKEMNMSESTYSKEKFGFIPKSKVPSVVGAKAWAQYRKDADAMTAAREAASRYKAEVLAAIAKKLNLGSADAIDFVSSDERITVLRRPKEKKARAASTLPDLSVASG